MASLLISLGTSPAIVPEALLLPGAQFTEVHVLTTENTAVDFVEQWLAANAPGVQLTITRVAGFSDFKSEQDHFHFEEVLYRWWMEKAGGKPPRVCLAGGFKTMSSAMQKAAAVMGAAEVFYVLCDLPQEQQPKTAATTGTTPSARDSQERSGSPGLRVELRTDNPKAPARTASPLQNLIPSTDLAKMAI